MRLRYTEPAARQLELVLDYIAERSPQGARHVQHRIQAVVSVLLQHPDSGQLTSRPGMRRVLATPYPYIIFYRVAGDEVVIHGVRHTARRPL